MIDMIFRYQYIK